MPFACGPLCGGRVRETRSCRLSRSARGPEAARDEVRLPRTARLLDVGRVWYDAKRECLPQAVRPSLLCAAQPNLPRTLPSNERSLAMIARLSRIVPLLVVLAVLALVVYLVVMYRSSPARAKEVLIKMFTVLTSALSAFFGLASLYAWFEGNMAVLDLTAGFLAASLLSLGITLACRAVFLRHNPAYRKKPMKSRRLGGRSSRRK